MASRWIDFWRIIAVLGVLDALALGLWTVLGWGTAAAQRAPPELLWGTLAGVSLCHLAVAGWGVLRKRRDAWMASIGAGVMVPITMPIGVIVVGGLLRLAGYP